jgi:exodeoxyribonuclease VII large subunit
MPLETSPEQPVPVRTVSGLLADWIGRLGGIWVEGQVAQLTRRPGASMAFLTLRDPAADVSLTATCHRRILDAAPIPVTEGARVVVHGKPSLYVARGTLSLAVDDIRPVGVGELLARLEQLKRALSTEGLFSADRKQPLPFLPATVGLICGRASAAERDVRENALRRWPGVHFAVRTVAVQGPTAVADITEALTELDADPDVDVIVITRGGGSVEDLLPFSDEVLVRAVAAALTPVISAIGHEQDTPLLDLVADVRASTPTDAARRIVPDVREQLALVDALRQRSHRAIDDRLTTETHRVQDLRARPALADPDRVLSALDVTTANLRASSRRLVELRLRHAKDELAQTQARVAALSPAATLRRGYAVAQRKDGVVIRSPLEVADGDLLRVRVSEGEFQATAQR